ncbi:hypothetical protein [Phytohalomonas tamaricis]|uniref:hypothetical protein n=1 Tax=Phytohalomonas tamaricis TaxID=2081032 RepID=UPI000D0B709A|nr:hypothetical protein [Phytohalomonas tamaricis]
MITSLSSYTAFQVISSTSQAARTFSSSGHAAAKDDSSNMLASSQQVISELAQELASNKEASRSEDLRTKRLNEALEGLQRLQDMPKQTKENKVGLQRQRLEMLKMLLLFASPKQANAIAKELKSIAKDLVTASKSLGGSSGNSLPSTADLEIDVASVAKIEGQKDTEVQSGTVEIGIAALKTQESGSVASVSDMQIDSTTRSAVIKDDTSTPTTFNGAAAPASNDSTPLLASEPIETHSISAPTDDDATLRYLLEEAQKLMKEVINALKAKLAEGDKEAKGALADVEKNLDKLHGNLSRNAEDSLYTALGSLLSTASGASAAVSVSVSPKINITV